MWKCVVGQLRSTGSLGRKTENENSEQYIRNQCGDVAELSLSGIGKPVGSGM